MPNKLPGKAVSVLMHRKRRIQQDKNAVEEKQSWRRHVRAKVKEQHKFRRPESFIMQHIKAKRTENFIKRTLFTRNILNTNDVEKTHKKLLLVMRHAGLKVENKTAKNILKSLRMFKRNYVVLLENSKENQILLKLVEPFVVYGYPTVSTVRELIYKKGFARIDRKSVPIESNKMIEEHLGDKNIICLEDIIHEIYTVGPNFKAVTLFLSPFVVNSYYTRDLR